MHLGNWLSLCLLIVAAVPAFGQSRQMEKTLILGDTLYTLMEPGGIPAIFAPEFRRVVDVGDDFDHNEPLMVVTVEGDVRAYSTWHLDEHEVVNDRFGELPLAVTW